jgi:hypothetical protein
MTPEKANYILMAIFTTAGAFSLSAGIFNWDWFFNNMNVKMLTGNIKRRWARLAYAVLGIVFFATAVYLACYGKN